MKFDHLHRGSKFQMMIVRKARLLLISCCTNIRYGPLSGALRRKYQRHLSLLKLMNFLSAAPSHFLRALESLIGDDDQNHRFHKTLLRCGCVRNWVLLCLFFGGNGYGWKGNGNEAAL